MNEPPPIIIDTRERKAYSFSGFSAYVASLHTGDYSLEGHTEKVCVERKSATDAYGCVGTNRKRFGDCLKRLGEIERPCIVVECSLQEFCNPPPRTRITPAQAVGSYISWSCQYRIPVFFCGSREYAERVTLRWLMAYWKHVVKGGATCNH